MRHVGVGIDLGTQKVTSLAAATAVADAVRLSQLIGVEPDNPPTYLIVNNGGTYEAYLNGAYTPEFSDTSLVTQVLNSIEADNPGGGYTVQFAPGNFDMGALWWTLNGHDDVTILGSGIGRTHVFNDTGASGSDTEPFSFTGCNRITIARMDITAGGDPATTSDAIDFDNGSYCLVEDVRILGSRGAGIAFDGKDTGAAADYNTIRRVEISGTQTTVGHGIKFLASGHNTVTDCYIHDTTGDGISIQKASNTAQQPNKQSNFNTVDATTRIINAGRDGVRILSSSYNQVHAKIDGSADDTANRDGIRIETQNAIAADYNFLGGYAVDTQTGAETQRYGVNVAPATASEANGNIIAAVTNGNTTGDSNDTGTGTLYASHRRPTPIYQVSGGSLVELATRRIIIVPSGETWTKVSGDITLTEP